MNRINTINGVLMASQDELNEHVENGTAHVTEEERTAWNAKADTSDLVSKVDVETFNAHTGDDAVHITEKDRNSWNGKQDKLTDEEGNMTLDGGMTAAAAINANGGVNIPLASLTSLSNSTTLNAYWAAGLIGLSDIWKYDVQVNRSGNTVYGDGELIDWPIGGQGVAVKVPKGGYGTADIGFSTYLTGSSWGNYGDYAGFYLPLGTLLLANASTGVCGKVKFTWSTYAENANRFVYSRDASNMDAFTIAPTGYGGVNASVVDVTIESVISGMSSVRVRVIYYDKTAKASRLMTVMANVAGLNNYAERCRGLVYCQNEKQGGVWLVVGGRVCKLAEIPRLDVYEVSGLSLLHVDVFGGDLPWTDSGKICFTRVSNFNRVIFGGLPCYDVIEAMSVNCQVSTETEPWTSTV